MTEAERILAERTPHSLEAEQSVLGAMLIDGRCVQMVLDTLSPADFYDWTNRAIYEVFRDTCTETGKIDPTLISGPINRKLADTDINARDYILQLMDITPTAANIKEYIKVVQEKSKLRTLQAALEKAATEITSHGDISDILSIVKEAAEKAEEDTGDDLGIICATDIAYEPPKWVLAPYFQVGKGTLIQGDPGQGKTAYMMAICSHITTGKPLMDLPVQKPGNVLILSVEDDLSVLRGRLEASGADLAKCYLVDGVGIDFSNPKLPRLLEKIKPSLVLFDPIQAFIGHLDMHRANETRPVLARLCDLCAKHGCACALISHLGKGTKDKSPVNRSLGSVDIPAAMRSVIEVGRNPLGGTSKVACHIKCSNAPLGGTAEFEIGDMGGIQWSDWVDVTPEDMANMASRAESGIDYESEPVVQLFIEINRQKPEGGFYEYSELKHMGEQLLSFPPFSSANDLKRKLNGGIARELQLREGIVVKHSQRGAQNKKGVKIERYLPTIPFADTP